MGEPNGQRVMLWVCLVVWSCGRERTDEHPVTIAPVTPTEQKAPDLVDARPADAPTSALHLPRHDVDATQVIWRTRDEVRKVLGAGTARRDGKWKHDLGDGEFVVVVYEHGRAAGIELPTAAKAGWPDYDQGQQNALATWGHVLDDPEIRGHRVLIGEDMTRSGLAIYEEEYCNRTRAKIEEAERAAEAKADAKRRADEAKAERARRSEAELEAARERPAREGFAEQFNELAASKGLPFMLELGKPDTTLSVVVTRIPCTKDLLALLVKTAEDHIRNVGFALVECSSDKTISVKP